MFGCLGFSVPAVSNAIVASNQFGSISNSFDILSTFSANHGSIYFSSAL